MSKGTVQFRGKDQVLQAFSARSVPVWGIWQDKTLQFKGEGEEDLRTFLTMLAEGGSKAVYTLKIFEDITDPKEVKEKTEADGSFNFQLYQYDSDGEEEGGKYGETNRKNRLFQRLEAIENKINGIGEADDVPEFSDVIRDEVIGVIQNPEKLVQWVSIIKGLFTPGINNQQQQHYQPALASIGKIETETTLSMTEQEKQNRLISAITILENADPKLLEHLEKLAMMAQDNPAKFKMLIGML